MTNKYDDRGIAHAAAIGLIAIVVAVVGFAGWRVMDKNKDDKSGTNSSAVSSAEMREIEKACNQEIDDKDFCKFASNFTFESSYKSTITTTGEDGTSVTEMETDGKGNSSMITKQDGKETGAFITLDNVSYYKDQASNSWFKMAGSDTETPDTEEFTDDIKVDTTDFKDDKSAYKKVGKEKCGNLNCFKYQITDKESPNIEQFIWFDDKDYQLRRWNTKEGANTTDMTIEYTSVNIKAPSPVKDFSAQSSADMDAAIRAAQEAMTASEE